MNILWIPHNLRAPGRRQTDEYLIDILCKKHKIFTAYWDSFLPHTLPHLANPWTYIKSLQKKIIKGEKEILLKIPRIPNHKFTERVNSYLITRACNYYIRKFNIDIVVTANTGPYPIIPQYVPVPVVIHYVDWQGWSEEKEHYYVSRADGVICVSEKLLERVKGINKNAVYIPNGVDINKFKNASGKKVRQALGIEDKYVVSIIGLTTGKSLYFIEGLKIAHKKNNKIFCLLVGDNPRVRDEYNRHPEIHGFCYYTGPVPYEEIHEYFAATDIGLNAVDYSPLFIYGMPIKVLEYTAAGKTVITPHLPALKNLRFPNLIFIEPEPQSLAQAILKAIKRKRYPINKKALEQFSLESIASKFEDFLIKTVKKYASQY